MLLVAIHWFLQKRPVVVITVSHARARRPLVANVGVFNPAHLGGLCIYPAGGGTEGGGAAAGAESVCGETQKQETILVHLMQIAEIMGCPREQDVCRKTAGGLRKLFKEHPRSNCRKNGFVLFLFCHQRRHLLSTTVTVTGVFLFKRLNMLVTNNLHLP